MKVVILAGGMGTRISEETDIRPKPMIEIGGKPIIWHIMKLYSSFGFNDFIICLGYKGFVIKEYFHHYYLHLSDVIFDMKNNKEKFLYSKAEPWNITLADTGLATMTGGRLKRIQKYLDNETFMMTYGDGLSDVNIPALLDYHKKNKGLATLTAVQPAGRFGVLNITDKDKITAFLEKPKGDGSWINGGFFVLEPEIFKTIENDQTIWEKEPMERLAKENQLSAFKHSGFWKPMDTLRDKKELEDMWNSGKAPWKLWKDQL
jgi:glucose-1-phosphate cytidylyltransferase